MKEELEDESGTPEQEETGEDTVRAEGTPAESDAAHTGLSEETDPDQLAERVSQISAERDDLKDTLIRKQAEFENFRKRTERERSDLVRYASAELMQEVLNVLDSFELALNNGGSDSESATSVREGFRLIYKQLVDNLLRFGLEPVEAEGQTFDPHLHQAVSTQPSEEVAEGMVLEELRKGYVLHGKLLRPAMVTVAAAPEADAGEEEEA